MKAQTSNHLQSPNKSENSKNTNPTNQTQKDQQKTVIIKCEGKNQVFQLCINQNCKSQTTFTCGSSRCPCQIPHKLCLKANLSFLLEKIESKIYNTDDIKALVQAKIDQIIDQISKFREKLISKIDQQIKYTNLVQVQKHLLKVVYESEAKQKSFSPVKSVILWKLLNKKEEQETEVFKKARQLLTTFEEQVKNSIKTVNDCLGITVEQQINNRDKVMNKIAESLNYQVFYSLTNSQKLIMQELMKKSSICQTEEMCERLINFFPKHLESMKLFFKASEHQFSVQKFFQLCGKIENTVILCKTYKGKIIGGYTPFSHENREGTGSKWMKDPERKSFIFSLTNNDKFLLNNVNHAIFCKQDEDQIVFGDYEIHIKNGCKNQTYGRLCFNRFYLNQNYARTDRKSFQNFNGNKSKYVTITQWQAWSILME